MAHMGMEYVWQTSSQIALFRKARSDLSEMYSNFTLDIDIVRHYPVRQAVEDSHHGHG